MINFMNEGKVTIERRGHVLLIGLDRVPKRNAFDVAVYHDLATAYGTLDATRTCAAACCLRTEIISPLALTGLQSFVDRRQAKFSGR